MDGMRKNYANSIKQIQQKANYGEFYFAKYLINNGHIRKAPVFIIGNDNDEEDIIICSCTSQPLKTDFDILVHLKMDTYVRTNKVYTIHRNQLLFKVPQVICNTEYSSIMNKIITIFNITSDMVLAKEQTAIEKSE